MSVTRSRSQLGNAVKRARRNGLDPAQDATVVSARRVLAEAKIAAFVRRALAAAPPLTQDQRDRIAALLQGGRR